MKYILKKMYILSLPFTSAFALTPVLPIPMIVIFLLGLSFVITDKFNKKIVIDNADRILLVFLFFVYFSFILNISNMTNINTPINHLISYSVSIFGLYLFVKHLFYEDIDLNIILKFITFAVLLSSIFAIFEFLDKNFLNIGVDSYIYRPVAPNMEVLATNFLFRARSFAEEPAHFALFLEIFAPLSIYYLIHNKYSNILIYGYVLVILFSLLFSFSSASFVIIPSATALTVLYFFIKNKNVFKKKSFFKLIVYSFFFIFFLSFLLEYFNLFTFIDLIDTVVNKITGSSSSEDRLGRVDEFYSLFLNADIINLLFGFGPAAYTNHNISSMVSLYLTLLLEFGFVGLGLFLFFLLLVLKKILTISSYVKYFLLIGYFSSIAHYALISNYWYPWFWFLVVLIGIIKNKEKNVHNI